VIVCQIMSQDTTSKATIEVAYINPPGAGKKQATIKSKDGQLFGIYPEKMGEYRAGNSYEIEFKTRDWNNKKYYTIVNANQVSSSNGSSDSSAAVNPSQDRGHRIERQHAQKVALEFLTTIGVIGDGSNEGEAFALVQKFADKFAADIENAGTVKVATLDEGAPDGATEVEI
jgi:predicted peptidase